MVWYHMNPTIHKYHTHHTVLPTNNNNFVVQGDLWQTPPPHYTAKYDGNEHVLHEA